MLVNIKILPATVSFLNAMKSCAHFDADSVLLYPHWHIIKEHYDHFLSVSEKNNTVLRIPKIIHQIWIGPPLPEQESHYCATWQLYHPDWEYHLWTDKDIEKLDLQNKKLYKQMNNPGLKSDIARYEILYRFGGLYIDTDFECLRSFDILHYNCDFYTGCSYSRLQSSEFVYNGLIGSIPGHPILKACIDSLYKKNTFDETAEGILYKTGPFLFSQILKKLLPSSIDIVAFPITYFYPLPPDQRSLSAEKKKSWIQPESFAIHHWHTSWIKKEKD